ncbi:hypothetical protein B0H10DRAFT_1948805 [Mycena sp. CBHHK59/15]|nr:hypothetical protein B0H10DRAFT_1948805 [Mycena sp. CBHHK59/15]
MDGHIDMDQAGTEWSTCPAMYIMDNTMKGPPSKTSGIIDRIYKNNIQDVDKEFMWTDMYAPVMFDGLTWRIRVRQFKPKQVPPDDYKASLNLENKVEIPLGSWVPYNPKALWQRAHIAVTLPGYMDTVQIHCTTASMCPKRGWVGETWT